MLKRRHGKDRAAVRFPPPLVFLLCVAAGVLAHRWGGGWLPGLTLPPLSGATRGLGIVALSAATLIIGVALFKFLRTGQNPEPWTPTPALVTDGVYRVTRNPMYLGMALAQLGIGLWRLEGWVLVMLPVAMALVHRIAIGPEEAYLRRKFGTDYEDYCRRVRRWL